ncbi:MAG: T9SS type A sorting domain-containing protein [Calditrichaeota bacterium]|nr:T9SS type A sorting domain-containing protein [Calditrichota bacterium]
MKKHFNVLFVVMLFMASFHNPVFSKTANVADIQKIAREFLTWKTSFHTFNKNTNTYVENITPLDDLQSNNLLAYIVNLAPEGFLVISAETNFEPVIAYSFRHNWIADTSAVFYKILLRDLRNRKNALSELPADIRQKNDRKWQIGYKIAAAESTFYQWPEQGSTATGGWLETTWHQHAPYNSFCPVDPFSNLKSQVGCVAIAMAQVVNYHKYIGNLYLNKDDRYETTYRGIKIDADSLKNDFPGFRQLNNYLQTLRQKYLDNTQLGNNDKAALSFACGILVKMDYTSKVSGSVTKNVAIALKQKMDYNSADFILEGKKFYDLLIENMMNGLPALLTLTGHVIVADGYNTDSFFHLNFGWGSENPASISDAWYLIPEYMPRNYNKIYDGVLNIMPSTDMQTRIVARDSLIYLPGSKIGKASEMREGSISNTGEEPINIEKIIASDHFAVSMTGNEFSDTIGPAELQPGEALDFWVRCTPDSFGRFEGNLQVVASHAGVKRYLTIDLVGYGVPDDRTVVYEGGISGVWDKMHSPYYICGDVFVEKDKKLEIQSGVKIMFENSYQFEIGPSSQLVAGGTEVDSISFYAEKPLIGWRGFHFSDSGDNDTLRYCVVKNVKTTKDKKSAFMLDNASPVISHSHIVNNRAYNGGAFYCNKSTAVIDHCRIDKNTANDGGAFYLVNSTLSIYNSLICNNTAERIGGAFFSKHSTVSLTNVTLCENVAQARGGAFNLNSDNYFICKNSILRENHAKYGSLLFFDDRDVVEFQYSDVDTAETNWLTYWTSFGSGRIKWGNGNLFTDPLFKNTGNGDYSLQSDSPCIDAGDASDDVAQEQFPHGFRINMGAYGGTPLAAQTVRTTLTITPDPIDFGNLKVGEEKELICYLKNGSPGTIHVSEILSSNPDHFIVTGFSASGGSTVGGMTLESGSIDSIKIKFTPKQTNETSFSDSLTIKTDECPDKYIEMQARIVYGTSIAGGPVSGTWVKENSPYNINGDILIPADSTLVIQAGVTVMFMGRYNINIGKDARLLARGSEMDSVRFYAQDNSAGWRGMKFFDSGADDSLRYCLITNIKNTRDEGHYSLTGAISMISSSPTITHCRIAYNSSDHRGILFMPSSSALIVHSLIERNTGNGLGRIINIWDSSPQFINTKIVYNKTDDQSMIYGYSSSVVFNNITMSHNKITRGRDALIMLAGLNHFMIHNSILWDNQLQSNSLININCKDILEFQYSDVDTTLSQWVTWSNRPQDAKGDVIWGTGSICKDPLFAEPEGKDFSLQHGSPCIDAGDPNDDVGLEPFPHGYRINMGARGGTKEAALTQNALITLAPFPLDFGDVNIDKIIEKTLYLKNGSLQDIHVTNISISDSTVFSLPNLTGENILLESGMIDSIKVKFNTGSFNGEKAWSSLISVLSDECPAESIKVMAHTRYGTKIAAGLVSGTWIKENSPYNIYGDVSVPSGGSLVIEPGVTVRFMGQYRLLIGENARLLANGTAADSIFFLADDTTKGWLGIHFKDSSDDDALSYCTLRDGRTLIAYSNNNGGVLFINNSSPVISHAKICYNHAEDAGGAIYCYNGNPEINFSMIYGNKASRGGGLFLDKSRPVISNCFFYKNTAKDGAALYCGNTIANLSNVTITQNKASHWGSALYLWAGNEIGFTNSIIWSNASPFGQVAYLGKASTLKFQYSDIDTTLSYWLHGKYIRDKNVLWEIGNICKAPIFNSPKNNNFSLQSDSPCIDAGNPSDDIAEEPFPHGYRINMGAFGGTGKAANTTKTILAVVPNPVDFGVLKPGKDSTLVCYLKNGSPGMIHISKITASASEYFALSFFTQNGAFPENGFELQPGNIDSFATRIHPLFKDEKIYSDSLTVQTAESGAQSILLHAKTQAGTAVQGGIINGIWTKDKGPYNVYGDIAITAGNALSIEPGTEIVFYGLFGLTVQENARLLALGAPKDSIKFCAADTSLGWHGIDFLSSGSDDTLKYCIITGGGSLGADIQGYGGAIYTSGSSPTIANCRITGNRAKSGGAVYSNGSSVTIHHSVIANNQADKGGAFFLQRSSLNLKNVIVCKNNASAGGAIYSKGEESTGIFENTTICYNFGKNSAGGIYLSGRNHFIIRNSILWGNFSIHGSTLYIGNYPNAKEIVDFYYSDIDTTKLEWITNFTSAGEIFWIEGNIVADPLFADPDHFDFTLQPGSPCIDTGDPDPAYNDPADDENPAKPRWPGMGTLRNDMGAYGGGESFWFTKVENNREDNLIPRQFALLQNYPNPFNPETIIEYHVPHRSHVSVAVYNLLGQKVITLVQGEAAAGIHKVVWHGRDRFGRNVGSGLYFYKFESESFCTIKKMILVR